MIPFYYVLDSKIAGQAKFESLGNLFCPKGQLISKEAFFFSILPKSEQFFFAPAQWTSYVVGAITT